MKQAPMPGYGMVWEPEMKTGLWSCVKDNSAHHIKAWELTQKPKRHVAAGDFRGHVAQEMKPMAVDYDADKHRG